MQVGAGKAGAPIHKPHAARIIRQDRLGCPASINQGEFFAKVYGCAVLATAYDVMPGLVLGTHVLVPK